jgi:GNAT superfamily N-acetyltransferase
VDRVTPLFVGYREFYRGAPEVERSRAFLTAMLETGQSVIFLALRRETAVGFVQMFRTYGTGALRHIWILNDLFVAPDARRHGVGRALMGYARDYATRDGAARLTLRTEVTNATAQALYESLGWRREEAFYTYNLPL